MAKKLGYSHDDKSVVVKSFNNLEKVQIKDISEIKDFVPKYELKEFDVKSLAVVPMHNNAYVVGVIVIEKEGCPMSEDDLMMLAIEAGAEDFSAEEEVYEITTAPNDFTAVTEELTNNNLTFLEAGVQQVPSTYVSLDEKSAEKMQRLIDNLDDLDDVLEVFHNWEE